MLLSFWIFNHTCGHSLGIGASTKRLFGLEKMQNTYQTTWLDRKKIHKEERENEKRIIDVNIDQLVVQVV